MIVKKLNEIFGYGFFLLGILKALLVFLVFIQFGANINAIFNGGTTDFDSYNTFSMLIGFSQIIFGIASIIMIVLNIKIQPKVIIGYIYGLGALLIEFITPSFLLLYFVFAECGLYIKAGTKIRKNNDRNYISNKKIKQAVKNTQWFYGNDDK